LIFHSDTLYSAICAAMGQLGWLEEWLGATALNPAGTSVRFTSLFPWQDNVLFAVPPRTHWPAPGRLRSAGIRFVPVRVIAALLAGAVVNEQHWEADPSSGCLLPHNRRAGRPGPFRIALRSAAAVDRLSAGVVRQHRVACLEFEPASGLWFAAEFAGASAESIWSPRLRACLRLLSDTGLGGERTLGWGHFEIAAWQPGTVLSLLAEHAAAAEPPAAVEEPTQEAPQSVEDAAAQAEPPASTADDPPMATDAPAAEAPVSALPAQGEQQPADVTAYWLLSSFNPAPADEIDWQRGAYSCVTRGGRIESPAGWGAAKRLLRMVEEGSVLLCRGNPSGRAVDVAPDGFAHPVYRAGFAVAVPVPWRVNA